MAEVLVSKSINVPAENAWKKLSEFNGIEEYSPVEMCNMIGVGVGATRICYMPDGATIYEELLKLEDASMELQYSIKVAPFPIYGYVSNIKVEKRSVGSCQIIWGCEFGVKPNSEEEMVTLFKGLFDTIIDGLENLISNQN